MKRGLELLAALGAWVLGLCREAGGMTLLCAYIGWSLVRGRMDGRELVRNLYKMGVVSVPIVALTATATEAVQKDICDQLKLPYPAFGGYRGLYGLPEIQVAPSNTSVIYAVIQDGFANNQTRGTFIYKSTDGGASFTLMVELNKSISADGSDVLHGANTIYKWVQTPLSLHVGNLDLDRERALQLPVVQSAEWSLGTGRK